MKKSSSAPVQVRLMHPVEFLLRWLMLCVYLWLNYLVLGILQIELVCSETPVLLLLVVAQAPMLFLYAAVAGTPPKE